jgi:ubiquinol-cytochrome c reductase iron-sulfur subunit
LAERDLSSISRAKPAPAEGFPSPKPAHARGLPESATAGHEFEGVARVPAVTLAGKARLMATSTGTAAGDAPAMEGDGVRRRDFINIAAVSAAGVGGLGVLVPLISQMAPSADVLAESTTELDISSIQPGQAIKAMYRKQPVFVRNLTDKEIAEANAVPQDDLRDPQTLAERTKEGRSNWLITMGVCTHLGCVPLGTGEGEPRGEFGGYFCPCHGSSYDTAARIRKGPAPKNLEVPDYAFTTDTTIVIGQESA